MTIQKTTLFLIGYMISLGFFCFAGYYFCADYAMWVQKQHVAHMHTNEQFQTDMAYVDLPRISITMASMNANHSGNVRLDITLEVETRYAAAVEGFRSRIADRLVGYMQSLDYDELSRPKATNWLRPDILQEVNAVSSRAQVKDVIFREFLVL